MAERPLHHLVLLRGLAREARHWGGFLKDLESAYEKQGLRVRISTLDFPGCGRHSEMPPVLSVEAMTAFVREKFAEMMALEASGQVERPAHRRLVAISLGGMVAAEWLSKWPTDFDSAVLINSSMRGLSKMHDRLRMASWWRIPLILKSGTVKERERQILEWISNRPDRQAEVLPDWTHIQETRPVSYLATLTQLAAASRFNAPDRIGTPLLVLASRQDRMVNPTCSEAIASYYKAQILFHPTAGHDLPLDAGPWCALMIAEWKN
ncbi:MAG: alpha/beta hydrolase [Bdellovibrionaceae bacterium]|nr:alpha/beta hydrolase [Pseudobdellovibrionaceae bacterium]